LLDRPFFLFAFRRAAMPPRTVLVLLAALAASIGFVMERPWLYVAAGVLVLGAGGLWGWRQWRARRREKRRASAAPVPKKEEDEEDDLRSLGIMDIRPQEEEQEDARTERPPASEGEAPEAAEGSATTEAQEASSRKPEAPAKTPPGETPPGDRKGGDDAPPRRDDPATDGEHEEVPSIGADDAPPVRHHEEEDADGHVQPPRPGEPAAEKPDSEKPGDEPEEREAPSPGSDAHADSAAPRPELVALVRALRLAAGARTACLLAQEELAPDYRVEAADADDEAPPLHAAGDVFATEEPLLSAHATRRAVTRRAVGGEDGVPPAHYRTPPEDSPEAVALIPVPLPDDAATRFLLLDGDRAALDGTDDALLERFGRLFARLLSGEASRSADPPAFSSEAAPEREEARAVENDAVPSSGNGHPERARPASARRDSPRPRGEIIAEEMQQARDEGHAMVLALVYLNRAEAVAERGKDEVQGAERALRARLRRALPKKEDGRVERFGELTYGVFLRRARAEAEPWAVALQGEMTEAREPLEGGVSVGLAPMRGPEQSPEDLRENATNALREAYTTGTCTVLE
jgi:GGDEF domain-containing protein